MTDKYLNIDLHDTRASAIAEVMTNKTCKKILDILAEKEMSESDISAVLSIPLNTVGYNMKKLKEAGLVEETKSFWSVKGKKVPFYSLANKKIIISPKRFAPAVMPVLAIIAVIVAVALIVSLSSHPPIDNTTASSKNNNLQYFSSYSEIEQYLKDHQQSTNYYGGEMFAQRATTGAPVPSIAAADNTGSSAKAEGGGAASDYSTTNIQVEGVDEPDIVKNDGKYIYAITGNTVVIVEAFPADAMHKVAEIPYNESISQLFIDGDKLIVIGNSYEYVSSPGPLLAGKIAMPCIPGRCGGYNKDETFIYVYDISDHANPELIQNTSLSGSFHDARLIDSYLYLLTNQYIQQDIIVYPYYRTGGVETTLAATDIAYVPSYDSGFQFTSVMAYNLDNGDTNVKTYLLSSNSALYVSQNNIYLTSTERLSDVEYQQRVIREVILPLLPNNEQDEIQQHINGTSLSYQQWVDISRIIQSYSDSLRGDEKANFDSGIQKAYEDFNLKIAKETERTRIHKISIDGMDISYEGAGAVGGHVLNQFSMDENKEYFRIATTTGQTWSGNSLNHLFILDNNLKEVGSVEDLALGESIHSVRFMGDRAYVVTFKKTDPFYVIDLSNPESPNVLGYLKIPGYSDYLHPYDENHIIGVGKNARGGGENFAYYQGVKISVFDVSDFANPKETATIEVGDRGTDSPALYDHKAFLFNKEKNLLVIPITLAKINQTQCDQQYSWNRDRSSCYGETIWQGAYAFTITPEDISIRGRISHFNEEQKINDTNRYWFYDDRYTIKRSLFMDDSLYTISSGYIKANDLTTGDDIKQIELPYPQYYAYPMMYGETAVSSGVAMVK